VVLAPIANFLYRLSSQLAAINGFTDRFNITEELRAGLDTEARLTSRNPAVYLDWIQSEVNQSSYIFFSNDICKRWGHSSQFIKAIAFPRSVQYVCEKLAPGMMKLI
jgi:hypothetical protein